MHVYDFQVRLSVATFTEEKSVKISKNFYEFHQFLQNGGRSPKNEYKREDALHFCSAWDFSTKLNSKEENKCSQHTTQKSKGVRVSQCEMNYKKSIPSSQLENCSTCRWPEEIYSSGFKQVCLKQTTSLLKRFNYNPLMETPANNSMVRVIQIFVIPRDWNSGIMFPSKHSTNTPLEITPKGTCFTTSFSKYIINFVYKLGISNNLTDHG